MQRLRVFLSDYKRLREKIRHRGKIPMPDKEIVEHEEVLLFDRVQVTGKATVLSDAVKQTVFELPDDGGVASLYLADTLQNRVRATERRRWTPQVMVFC